MTSLVAETSDHIQNSSELIIWSKRLTSDSACLQNNLWSNAHNKCCIAPSVTIFDTNCPTILNLNFPWGHESRKECYSWTVIVTWVCLYGEEQKYKKSVAAMHAELDASHLLWKLTGLLCAIPEHYFRYVSDDYMLVTTRKVTTAERPPSWKTSLGNELDGQQKRFLEVAQQNPTTHAFIAFRFFHRLLAPNPSQTFYQ